MEVSSTLGTEESNAQNVSFEYLIKCRIPWLDHWHGWRWFHGDSWPSSSCLPPPTPACYPARPAPHPWYCTHHHHHLHQIDQDHQLTLLLPVMYSFPPNETPLAWLRALGRGVFKVQELESPVNVSVEEIGVLPSSPPATRRTYQNIHFIDLTSLSYLPYLYSIIMSQVGPTPMAPPTY